MADQNKPLDAAKTREKLQDAAGGLDDSALDTVSGGTEAANTRTCLLLCGGGKEKTAD